MDWLCRSLLPQISRDVALGGVVTEDQSIHFAQHLDLIYSQSDTLYEIIPNAPGNPNTSTISKLITLPTTVINSVQSTQNSNGKKKKNKKKTAPSEEQSTKQQNPK